MQARAAAVHALVSATAVDESEGRWKLLSHHFATLFDDVESVAQLRQAILDLAVMGLLDGPRRRTSENGDLPTGWRWVTGDETFPFVTSGSRGWAQYYADDGAIFLRIGNLDYGTIDLDLRHIQRVKPPKDAEGTRTRVKPGDILLSITGDTGMVGLVPDDLGEAYINQHIALARPAPTVVPEFIAYALTAPSVLGRVQAAQRGIKNSLGLEDLRNLRIPLPPFDAQHAIVQKIRRLLAACRQLEGALKKLGALGARAADALVAASAT